MTKEKLVWRLGKLPSVDELRELVKDKIITHDEAREILFNKETEGERDKKSLQDEIKFLRELVEKLSNNQTIKLIETIREVERPYTRWDWYKPYTYYCGSIGNNTIYAVAGNNLSSAVTTGATNSSLLCSASFKDINTF